MRTRLFPLLVGGATVIVSTAVYPQQSPEPTVTAASQQAIVTRYCVNCHNERAKTGGLYLETTGVADVGAHSEIWERVVQKLRGNLMPPPDRPRLDATTYKNLIAYLER